MIKTESTRETAVPLPRQGKRGDIGYIGYLLRQAANAYESHLVRTLGDQGITPPQFSVMTMISAYPGLSNADIARLSFLTPQTVGVIAGNLVKGNIATKHAHAVHGRIQQLELTDLGRRRMAMAIWRACSANLWSS
nr:MarR family winged helix-turn-helix transcriptional regulator [uncultured Cohaesibacter sp.]